MSFAILLTLMCSHASGQTADRSAILIKKSGAVRSAIDLTPLAVRDPRASRFKQILEADLERSGWFTVSRRSGTALVVQGACTVSADKLRVRYRVVNSATQRTFIDEVAAGSLIDDRRLAHAAADKIVKAVKGCPGIASTRIVMIGTRSGAKEVYVCDSDGNNLLQITTDESISVAPNWYPAGNAIVYTSFRTSFPSIYRIDLAESPRRQRISNYPGLNVCAAISPDSRKMALALSKDGNPDLYSMDLKTQRLVRVTRTRNAAEASPSWSPDGRQLVFVSDSAGKPYLYVANRDGTRPKRLTSHVNGSETVSPDWGPNGLIAYSSRRGGRYQICVVDPKTGKDEQYTFDLADNEDPSWAPDGRHIAYTRTADHRSHVYVLDTFSKHSIRLTREKGDWHSPAWSPK